MPTIKVDGVDLSTWAHITSWEGILLDPPIAGDLIRMDWQPGAVWQPGPPDVYSFEVPLVMKAQNPAESVNQLRAVQAAAKPGVQVTITREYDDHPSGTVTETCTAVCTGQAPITWDLTQRAILGVVLIFQNLSGGWS